MENNITIGSGTPRDPYSNAFRSLTGLYKKCSTTGKSRDDATLSGQHRSQAHPRTNCIDVVAMLPELSALPSARRYVLGAIQSLDAVLADIERAGATIGVRCITVLVRGAMRWRDTLPNFQ